MTVQEFEHFRLRTLSVANGRNIHDLPPLLAYMRNAVQSLNNGSDIDFSNTIIDMTKKNIQRIIRK